ncbi:uncharacterized protein LOC141836090 [Curcuma longa]|uniref:uncharacterized protein LOC141836090 n=1 Tax=Curcuma longa TaxID=136217 RepID=UPI003D9F1EDC
MTSLNLRTILDTNKLTGSNFLDWYRNLRIVLKSEKLAYVLDDLLPGPLVDDATDDQKLEDTSAVQHVLKMYGYIERLGSLDFAMDHELSIDLILHSLPESYSYFVMNYRINHIESTIPEMINMLKTIEPAVKSEKKVVMLVDSSKKGSKRKATRQAKGKKKKKAKVTEPASKGSCHHCGKMGHWRRNCKTYLESVKGKKG